MPAMSRQQKIDRSILWLTHHHLFAFGGYPHDYCVHAGLVFVADLNDGKERAQTDIVAYRLDDLAEWYDDAVRKLEMNGDWPIEWPDEIAICGDWGECWFDAFNNSRPEPLKVNEKGEIQL